MEQKTLLRIVKTWTINQKPEYRGFRCANCQKYIRKAWHYWLEQGGYRTPVHFCNVCDGKFKSLKIKGIYKPFTCDKCGGKMRQAWHIWQKKDGILSESHLCKKCYIKDIIYDLDGTIISTIKLHKSAWLVAGKKFNIYISDKMLLNQSGVSNEAAAKMMLPRNKSYLTKRFVAAKTKYVMANVNQATLFPSVIKTIKQLVKMGNKVWLCTSAHKNFVQKILNNFKELKKIVQNNVVWREMYKKEKPSSEVLSLVMKKMSLSNSQVYYIGDAFSDYKTSIASKVKFIYFCPNIEKQDARIPKSVLTISSHKEIFKLLE